MASTATRPAPAFLSFAMRSPVISSAGTALTTAARGADKTLIADVALFDVYRGPELGADRKSVALCVTLQPRDATLTDAEIEAVGERIVAAVSKATGAVLRG